MSDWFGTGWGEVDDAAKVADSDASDRKFAPFRFWMPVDDTKRVIFLDDEPLNDGGFVE